MLLDIELIGKFFVTLSLSLSLSLSLMGFSLPCPIFLVINYERP